MRVDAAREGSRVTRTCAPSTRHERTPPEG